MVSTVGDVARALLLAAGSRCLALAEPPAATAPPFLQVFRLRSSFLCTEWHCGSFRCTASLAQAILCSLDDCPLGTGSSVISRGSGEHGWSPGALNPQPTHPQEVPGGPWRPPWSGYGLQVRRKEQLSPPVGLAGPP